MPEHSLLVVDKMVRGKGVEFTALVNELNQHLSHWQRCHSEGRKRRTKLPWLYDKEEHEGYKSYPEYCQRCEKEVDASLMVTHNGNESEFDVIAQCQECNTRIDIGPWPVTAVKPYFMSG